MTDVEVMWEGCEHAFTQPEARTTAKEIIQLVHVAEALDAPPPPKIVVQNGRVSMATVRAVMAHRYNRPNLVKWHTDTLWSVLTHIPWVCDVYCLSCSKLHDECSCQYRHEKEYFCIPLDQIFGHYWEFAGRKPALSHDYGVLTRHLETLTAS